MCALAGRGLHSPEKIHQLMRLHFLQRLMQCLTVWMTQVMTQGVTQTVTQVVMKVQMTLMSQCWRPHYSLEGR
jgi:hypothetical protein